MLEFDIPDIKNDLPISMTMAAFSGIAWYIAFELNIRLFYLFKRRKGLYFWSCALSSWGVFFHPLFIILADFQVIKATQVAVPFIYLTWWLMVIPQSLVMYSRLHIIMSNSKTMLRFVLGMIIFTTVCISIPSMVMGPMSQQPTPAGRRLVPIYSIWLKIENATWFIQETLISIIYIIYTHKNLKDLPLFSSHKSSLVGPKRVMHHLIATNLLIIVLDVALVSIVYAGMFYLGGSFKPAVYGVKLRVEFSILNRLVEMVKIRGSPFSRYGVSQSATGAGTWTSRGCCEREEKGIGRPASARYSGEGSGGALMVREPVHEQGIQRTTKLVVESSRMSQASTSTSASSSMASQHC